MKSILKLNSLSKNGKSIFIGITGTGTSESEYLEENVLLKNELILLRALKGSLSPIDEKLLFIALEPITVALLIFIVLTPSTVLLISVTPTEELIEVVPVTSVAPELAMLPTLTPITPSVSSVISPAATFLLTLSAVVLNKSLAAS